MDEQLWEPVCYGMNLAPKIGNNSITQGKPSTNTEKNTGRPYHNRLIDDAGITYAYQVGRLKGLFKGFT
jgi:hypothetical protein